MRKIFKYLLRGILVLFICINIITAFHAYKFTHFFNAGTAGIKKTGDKTSWDKMSDILFGINAFKKINTKTPDTVFETVYLKTKDNLKLEGWYIPASNAKGTVCMFHGHGGNKSDIYKESIGFRNMGYSTFLLDARAHGNSDGNTSTIGYNESEDVKLAYDFVKAKGEKNIVLWGISMGAATVTKAMNDYHLPVSKIILEMPFASIVKAAEGRIKMMHLPGEPLASLITFWGGVEHGFWAFNMQPSEYVKKIDCPTLVQWGSNDPRVSKEEIDDIYQNIHAVKKLVIYDSSGHESLCKKENEKWLSAVNDFMK